VSDPIERAKAHAATMYPEATITTRSIRGRPVVLATTDNLIRLIQFADLDTPGRDAAEREVDPSPA
jgi:hypothetical protein